MLMALDVYVCYQALTVFVVFCLDGRVFMWSGVMHVPNVVSSLRLFPGLEWFPAPP